MNEHPILNMVLRYVVILLSMIGTVGLFLFLPSPAQPEQQSGYNYYRSLIGTASDELSSETDNTQALPEVKRRKTPKKPSVRCENGCSI